jgi:antitoxin (DNA-binding transcriptional repressor) of toxin-antitoxin stability system
MKERTIALESAGPGLAEWVARARREHTIFVVLDAATPVARLVPVPAPEHIRKLGIYGDTIKIADDFDAPLPDEILDLFEGRQPRKRKKS